MGHANRDMSGLRQPVAR